MGPQIESSTLTLSRCGGLGVGVGWGGGWVGSGGWGWGLEAERPPKTKVFNCARAIAYEHTFFCKPMFGVKSLVVSKVVLEVEPKVVVSQAVLVSKVVVSKVVSKVVRV